MKLMRQIKPYVFKFVQNAGKAVKNNVNDGKFPIKL